MLKRKVAAIHLNTSLLSKRVIIPMLAFLLPLLIRTIPEVLVGPHVIGFDTMAFYIPNTLSWMNGGVDLWSYLTVAPSFYLILISMVTVGIPIIFSIKIIAPLLLGFLGLSIFYYAHKSLCWTPIKSLIPALLGTVYFVALRVSWDMLRNELGLIFLFIFLYLLSITKNNSSKYYVALFVSMIAIVFSHQLVSVIMLAIIFFNIIYQMYYKNFQISIRLIVTSLPIALIFFFVYFIAIMPVGLQDFVTSGESPLANWLGFPTYQSMLISEAGFLLYCYLPLLPITLFGFNKLKNFQLRIWLLFSFILAIIPFAFVSPYRWLILLIYPLAFYTAESLSRLKLIRWSRLKINIQAFALLYVILSTLILSFGYVVATPENPFYYFNPSYFNSYPYQIPTSMLQNTIPTADFIGTRDALTWFSERNNNDSILLTHTAFYSWALLTIDSDNIINYGFDKPDKAAISTQQEGYSNIFLIWWVKGEGWYAETTLSSDFTEVYHSERIAIYQFNNTR